MPKLLLWLFLLVSFDNSAVEPLSAQKLFSSNDNISIGLSPSGTYVLSFDIIDDVQVVQLINPKQEIAFPLLEIENVKSLRIKSYEWVDDATIYVQLGTRKGFLKLSYSDKKVTAKWHYVKSRGYLVNGLKNQNNRLLFAHQPMSSMQKVELYFISPDQLIAEDYKSAQRYPVELKKAFRYFYDDSLMSLLTYKVKSDGIEFWMRKQGTKKWRKYLTLDPEVQFKPIGFINDTTLAVLTNKDYDLMSLAEFDIPTQTFGKLIHQHNMYDLTDAQLSPSGTVQSVSYVDHGVPRVEYMEKSLQQFSTLLEVSFSGGQPVIVDKSSDSEHYLIGVFGSDNPGEYFYFNKAEQKAIKVGSTKTFDQNIKLSPSKSYIIDATDGTPIEATLNLPQSNDNGVLLVYPHGGPVGVRDYAVYDAEVQYYTSRGYAVLKVNFRGSAGFGKNFLERGKGQFGELIEQDISAAVDSIQADYQFKHKCAMGSSYGGYSAVMLAIKHPEQYDCVVSKYGIYDLPLLFNASNFKTLEKFRKTVEEVVGENNNELKLVSPFYFAEKLQAPTLLIAGEEDNIADFEQANRMKYRLNQLNKNFEYLFYEGVGHGHRYWWGEQHQAALVDDYIRRTLNIPRNSNTQTDSAFGEDLALIADGYNFENSVPFNKDKAHEYYLKAAEFGHPRAALNVAIDFHFGNEPAEKNTDKALDWYKKSLKAGYAGAGVRLGDIYRKGEIVAQDLKTAYDYYNQDLELENELADLYIGRAYCLGEYVTYDLEKCLDTIFLRNKTERELKLLSDRYRSKIRHMVNDIMWADRPANFDLTQFKQNLINAYGLSTLDVEMDRADFGTFGVGHKNYRITSTANDIENKMDLEFGASIHLDKKGIELIGDKGMTMVKVRWTAPKSIEKRSHSFVSKLNLLSRSNYKWIVNTEEELITGTWRLEIETLDGERLFDESFNLTYNPDEDINVQGSE